MPAKKSTLTSVKTETASTAGLEAKIAELEAKLEALTKALAEHEAKSEKEHAELAKKCEAKTQSAGGQDAELRKMLKKYFATINNPKGPTLIPKL